MNKMWLGPGPHKFATVRYKYLCCLSLTSHARFSPSAGSASTARTSVSAQLRLTLWAGVNISGRMGTDKSVQVKRVGRAALRRSFSRSIRKRCAAFFVSPWHRTLKPESPLQCGRPVSVDRARERADAPPYMDKSPVSRSNGTPVEKYVGSIFHR